jgi:flagellar assembly protein FliH
MAGSRRLSGPAKDSLVTPIPWRQTGAPEVQVAKFEPQPVAQPKIVAAQDDERSYERGYADGIGAGRAQAESEVRPVLDQLARSLAELNALRPRVRKSAERDLIKLALAVARKVLHRELTVDAESISGLIKVALEKLQSREVTRVRVHPEHEAAIKSLLDRYGASQMEVYRDSSLERGDVLFETPHGTLDASIEAQLREIERGLADRLNR